MEMRDGKIRVTRNREEGKFVINSLMKPNGTMKNSNKANIRI